MTTSYQITPTIYGFSVPLKVEVDAYGELKGYEDWMAELPPSALDLMLGKKADSFFRLKNLLFELLPLIVPAHCLGYAKHSLFVALSGHQTLEEDNPSSPGVFRGVHNKAVREGYPFAYALYGQVVEKVLTFIADQSVMEFEEYTLVSIVSDADTPVLDDLRWVVLSFLKQEETRRKLITTLITFPDAEKISLATAEYPTWTNTDHFTGQFFEIMKVHSPSVMRPSFPIDNWNSNSMHEEESAAGAWSLLPRCEIFELEYVVRRLLALGQDLEKIIRVCQERGSWYYAEVTCYEDFKRHGVSSPHLRRAGEILKEQFYYDPLYDGMIGTWRERTALLRDHLDEFDVATYIEKGLQDERLEVVDSAAWHLTALCEVGEITYVNGEDGVTASFKTPCQTFIPISRKVVDRLFSAIRKVAGHRPARYAYLSEALAEIALCAPAYTAGIVDFLLDCRSYVVATGYQPLEMHLARLYHFSDRKAEIIEVICPVLRRAERPYYFDLVEAGSLLFHPLVNDAIEAHFVESGAYEDGAYRAAKVLTEANFRHLCVPGYGFSAHYALSASNIKRLI